MRIGEVSTSYGTFSPWIRLYSPGGVLIEEDASASDAQIAHSVTNGGVYTVVVENYDSGGAGTYNLRYANAGKTFVVPVGDEGGGLANCENHFGVIGLADIDMWTFSADAGDSIRLRIAEVSTDLGAFSPWILLYGPDGSFIKNDTNSSDAEIVYSATTGGVYTVVVENYISGGAGTYNLRYANVGKSFVVPAGDEGGALTNGANHVGIIDLADVDLWTFSADEGDSIILRAGEVSTELVSFSPWILLYGPDGSFINHSASSSDALISHSITTGGVYTVVVENYVSGGAGTYNLRYANAGKAFVVPAGDEGGALTNGANHVGTTDLGDVDLWTFSADEGDSIMLRVGEVSTELVSFSPWILLYGPDGSFITHSTSSTDTLISHSATAGGVYTLVIENYIAGGAGTYNLRFANIGNPFMVPPGDNGGALSAESFPEGELELGDLDLFEFSACAGDPIQLDCIELVDAGGMTLQLNLYDPDGVLINSDTGSSEATIPLLAAPAAGTYTILVFSYSAGGTGTYRLEHNGLQDGIRLCSAEVNGLDETVFGVGAEPGSTNVLWSTTNLVTGTWEPTATNFADSAGFVIHSNELDTAEDQRFFKVERH
ncbi:pre-peptidase C-terminal domain-containing protein [Pontiellaceae bacterium B1224]|nr:pre-peptidase C-terminal domain-containing protein [Pontiellaceae bacterium B1224]